MSEPRRGAASQAAAIERWSLPEVKGPVIGRAREDRKPGTTVDLVQQALQEGEARGYQAGVARAQAESQAALTALQARVAQLDGILQLLSRPLQQLDADVEKELLQLALAVGKQLARRELRIDPTQVIGIIRESLLQLPAAARDIRVHLHPQDAATVRERLAAPASERAWSIVEDPTLTRGGCIVRTDVSQIDVRLESRISSVIANALGEERAPERPAEPPESEA
ncbi:MAG TPA: flagellar assembly protein FliH [Steroidobacteraceae bacterium]|nr:flagellar assembly protein FliH [Steroidobacteraceae bacterium]